MVPLAPGCSTDPTPRQLQSACQFRCAMPRIFITYC